jgi:hypothetical protein
MTILLNLVLIFGLLLYGSRFFKETPLKKYYWPAVLLKIFMGLLVGILYQFYYDGGDTYAFFASAVTLKNNAFASSGSFIDIYFKNDYTSMPGFPYTWIPSAFFVKLLAIFALITGENYWLSGAYFSLFSFFGLWIWTSTLTRLTQNHYLALFAGFLFPSLLFWSSGLLKEALVIPALAMLLALFLKYYFGDKLSWRKLFVALLLFILLAIVKYFVAAIFLALALAVLIARKILAKEGNWPGEVATLVLIIFVSGGVVSLLHPNLWPTRIASVIYTNYEAYLATSAPGATVTYPGLSVNMLSLVVALPKAIFAGLFFPLLPVQDSLVSYFSVIENWVLLILTIASLGTMSLPRSREQRLLMWAGILFILISAGLIALSTPNLGTLARYKTSYLLILLPFITLGIFKLFGKVVGQG